jgi:hypothetical protein
LFDTQNENLILSTSWIILNFNHNILQKRIDFEVSVVNHLNLFSYGLQKFLYPISFSINSINGVVGLLWCSYHTPWPNSIVNLELLFQTTIERLKSRLTYWSNDPTQAPKKETWRTHTELWLDMLVLYYRKWWHERKKLANQFLSNLKKSGSSIIW